MKYIQADNQPIALRLGRDLTRVIKRGHPWVFADSLRRRPQARAGAQALLLDNKQGRELGRGFYDPASPLAFRVCVPEAGADLDDAWAEARFEQALALRRSLFDGYTTGFRLFNGEGDGLPGLVCDVYGETAVLQLDGAGPQGFWRAEGVARWLAGRLSLRAVYESSRNQPGRAHVGPVPAEPVPFVENGVQFTTDVVAGQKTGFFLDQRENRARIGRLAGERHVLNLFGYTGGFSVYAGLGGAVHVTTVDVAAPALAAADRHWALNGLTAERHASVAADVFEFLDKMGARQWDLVIADPPSFAPSRQAVPKALAAYKNLVASSATATRPGGLLAAASCSSHVDLAAFLAACEAGISRARCRATVLSVAGQPPDHPAPLVLPEFRYLKFVLMRINQAQA